MFSQTLAHGNSMNEIRQRKRRRYEEMREHGKKYIKWAQKNEVPKD